jgi:hypothetical protein
MENVQVEKLTVENLRDCFEYHPWNEEQTKIGGIVREALMKAAEIALREIPDCPDRSVGLRKLREARMDFNSAITHRGRF